MAPDNAGAIAATPTVTFDTATGASVAEIERSSTWNLGCLTFLHFVELETCCRLLGLARRSPLAVAGFACCDTQSLLFGTAFGNFTTNVGTATGLFYYWVLHRAITLS